MERVLIVAAVACMLLGQVGAQGSGSLTDFLTDPLYQPFIQIVRHNLLYQINQYAVSLERETVLHMHSYLMIGGNIAGIE